MSARPRKPLTQAINEYADAMDSGDPEIAQAASHELRRALQQHYRKLKYQHRGYVPKEKLEALIDMLPLDFDGADFLMDTLDSRVERKAAAKGRGNC